MDYPTLAATNVTRWYKTAKVIGKSSAEKVGWASTYNQQIRFKILSQIGDLNNKTVLDFGCGLGDFYPYIKSIYPLVKYSGIDFLAEYIEANKIKYPEVEFQHGDSQSITQNYDYIITSGVFSYKIDNANLKYKEVISTLYQHSNIAFGGNFLVRGKHIDNSIYNTWDPKELSEWASRIANRVKFIDNYLPHDFTLFLFHY